MKPASELSVCGRETEESTAFPFLPKDLPTQREYGRMMLFVSVHLTLVLLLVGVFWVPRTGAWESRLIFAVCSVAEALLRVGVASWWLKAASLKMALVFAEIDFVTLALVGLACMFVPSVAGHSLQYEFNNPSMSLSESMGGILLSSTLRESCKLLGYLVPFAFRQIRCSSHLLFTGATAGALNLLYGDIFSGFKPEESTLWHLILVSLSYTMLYTLWTSMGAAILCQIKQNRLRALWCPLILLVPVIFHSCYLMAVFGRSFGWQWALITVGYWVGSGIALKLMLTGVTATGSPSTSAFVSGAVTVV